MLVLLATHQPPEALAVPASAPPARARWRLFCKRVGARASEKGAAANLILSSYSIRHPLELKIGKYAHIGKIYERERFSNPCHPVR